MFVPAEFANVLEQLESQFYAQALAKFQASDFTSAGFSDAQVPIEQFTAIGNDESTHATVLTQAISDQGGTPIPGCSFDFSSVLTDVPTMAVAARLVENVGVGAYLGAHYRSTIDDSMELKQTTCFRCCEPCYRPRSSDRRCIYHDCRGSPPDHTERPHEWCHCHSSSI